MSEWRFSYAHLKLSIYNSLFIEKSHPYSSAKSHACSHLMVTWFYDAPMSLDVFSPVISLARLAKAFYKLHSLEEEIRVYGEALEEIDALIFDVESTLKRPSTVVTPETRERIDRKIRRTKSALEQAKSAVGWSDEVRGGAQVITERIKWAFKCTDAAKVHLESLSRCHHTLLWIGHELDKANERQPWPRERYYQETQANAIASLAREAIRHATAYSGAGDRAPRLSMLGPESLGT